VSGVSARSELKEGVGYIPKSLLASLVERHGLAVKFLEEEATETTLHFILKFEPLSLPHHLSER